MTDYDALWASIDALLREHAPKAFRGLRAPIKDAGLAWLQATARKGGVRRLDPAVVATYKAHDGAKGSRPSILALLPEVEGAQWAASCEWHSSWISREELAKWQDVRGGDDPSDAEGDPGWPSRWLPIGRDGGGDAVVLTLGTGEIFAFDHEVAEPVDITTLGAFLVELESDLRQGLVGEDEEGELCRGGRTPVRAAPARDEHQDARVFLALLLEKRFAAVEPTLALVEALTPLLKLRGKKTRNRRVRALLYEHDDVADVFADDDVLAVLLDEFG